MKIIVSSKFMDIPKGITKVQGKGNLGKRSLMKHLNLDFVLITDEETAGKQLKVNEWFGSRKAHAAIRLTFSRQSHHWCDQDLLLQGSWL